MATRNLARTVVEGGRSWYSKLDRKLRNRSERRLRFDPEGDLIHGQPRRAGSRGFADRLAPLERWVARHVGRGWANVYHEFCERYDDRSIKGWHLRDHLLHMLESERFPWAYPFYVDRRGILRRGPRYRWPRNDRISFAEEMRALAWAGGRRVIVHGEAAFWTARAIASDTPTSAQGRRLTAEEFNVWKALSYELRQKLEYDAEANRRNLAKVNELRGRLR